MDAVQITGVGGKNMSATITKESMNAFRSWLRLEERSEGTIDKYMRDMERLSVWLDGREMTKEMLTE